MLATEVTDRTSAAADGSFQVSVLSEPERAIGDSAIENRMQTIVAMASGFAHISGGMMVVYINYGADPVAVLTTCIMACPCSLYLSKLFMPERGMPETAGTVHTAAITLTVGG